MKVHTVSLVIAGFPRCPQVSLPRLAEELDRNLSSLPYKFDLRYHLIMPPQSSGGTKKEILESMIRTSLAPTRVDVKTYSDQPSSFGTAEVERISSQLWNPYPKHSRKSVNNHLRLLGLLSRISTELDSDMNFFIRADLVPVGPINLEKYISLAHDSIVTPSWHTWGGINDRVAIVPQHLTAKYFDRLSAAKELLQSGQPIHGETFLEKVLENTSVHAVMEDEFARTTLGGNVRKENFSRRRHRLRTYFINSREFLHRKKRALLRQTPG